MIPITFFRSSSFTGFDHCQQQWYITYCLGHQSLPNKAAVKGTMLHKAMEALAQAKWCKQHGTTKFDDDALGRVFLTDCVPNLLVDRAFEFFSKQERHLEFTSRDLTDVKSWMWKTLSIQNGRFDPRKCKIVAPEVHFDFPIEEEWAKYAFETAQGKLEGQLRLKGTSDLVIEASPGIYEIIDYKSGRRVRWSDMKEKTYKYLCNDPQLRIYHYAVSKLYPEIETVLCTILFMNDGGSFTVCFGKNDLVRTEAILRQQFNRIRKTERPRLDKGSKCRYCYFNKNQWTGDPKGRTVCEFIKDEYIAKGQRYVESNYTHPGFKIGFYAAPGATK